MRVLMVVYDNDAYMHWFPQGLAYIAAVLRKEGHDVEVYSQDMHHYPDEHLKTYLDENPFDVVCCSFIAGYYQYRRMKGLSRAINESTNRPFYILGGHGPSPEPDYYLQISGADVVVCGEGEQTAVTLLDRLEHKQPWGDVPGIAFMDGNQVTITPRYPLITDWTVFPSQPMTCSQWNTIG